jgi:hypothetical protein
VSNLKSGTKLCLEASCLDLRCVPCHQTTAEQYDFYVVFTLYVLQLVSNTRVLLYLLSSRSTFQTAFLVAFTVVMYIVGIKDSVLQPSSPLRHACELKEILKLRACIKYSSCDSILSWLIGRNINRLFLSTENYTSRHYQSKYFVFQMYLQYWWYIQMVVLIILAHTCLWSCLW